MFVVETQDLTKRFSEHTALDGLNLKVPKDTVFGFLGPNGAGKTTTIRILLGLAKATSGKASILGMKPSQANKKIGFLPDVPAYYDWMTAPEFLDFTAEIFGLRKSEARVGELLTLTGLDGVKTRIGGFSRGMKQRLGIAQALVNDPELVILDEPTSALDPIGRKEVLDCIAGLKGRTVLFSTHILSDVERVCQHVAVLKKGKIVAQETIENLREKYATNTIMVEVEEGETFKDLIEASPAIDVLSHDGHNFRLRSKDASLIQIEVPKLVASSNMHLKRFEPLEPTLEEIFIDLVGGEEQ